VPKTLIILLAVPFSAVGAVLFMRAALREMRPDVVQLHDPHAVSAGLIAARVGPRAALAATRRVDFRLRGALSRWKYGASAASSR
jgi:hypothetical protein